MTRLPDFILVYTQELTRAVADHPAEYGFPVANVPTVVEKMRAAIEVGSFNHDGRAFKATCKRLGIKYTRRAINDYVRGVPT